MKRMSTCEQLIFISSNEVLNKDGQMAIGPAGRAHVHLITKVRGNMKPVGFTLSDQTILRQRVLIATLIDELKTCAKLNILASLPA